MHKMILSEKYGKFLIKSKNSYKYFDYIKIRIVNKSNLNLFNL